MIDLQKWVNDKLQACAERESYLLGNTKQKDWLILLQYELGKRDLLWELQKFLQEQDDDER